jgi:predicted dithiol-disulfide oxidoreductase (DUF899 family)
VPLIDVFEGRRQLLVYFHMWHDGKPAPEQCEGCTFCRSNGRPTSQWSRLAAGRSDDLTR